MPFNFTSGSMFTLLVFLGMGTIAFLLSLPFILQKEEKLVSKDSSITQ